MSQADVGEEGVLRDALVDQLKNGGYLRTPRIEAAFRAVPRHLFLPGVPLDQVYQDQSVPVKERQGLLVSASSQPTIMASMLEQLQPLPGQRVLEIGAGSGYNAALLAHLVGERGQVVTVDIEQDLVEAARTHLATAGVSHVQVVCGDGSLGYPAAAPYDRIILTVGSWDLAIAWREQLAPTGRLVLPLSLKGVQVIAAFEPQAEALASVSITCGDFMMLRGAFASPGTLITIGPEPAPILSVDDLHELDPSTIYQLLTGPSQEVPTHVWATQGEIGDGLLLWVALQEPAYCRLMAEATAVARGLVPDLQYAS